MPSAGGCVCVRPVLRFWVWRYYGDIFQCKSVGTSDLSIKRTVPLAVSLKIGQFIPKMGRLPSFPYLACFWVSLPSQKKGIYSVRHLRCFYMIIISLQALDFHRHIQYLTNQQQRTLVQCSTRTLILYIHTNAILNK